MAVQGKPLVQRLDDQFAGYVQERYSWWLHWQELANFILPRRYKWLITANQFNRGSQINAQILDSTGTLAARRCAGGMMGGICSPTDRWFKLKLHGMSDDETPTEVKWWLVEVEKRMMHVFSSSNFYDSMSQMFLDLVVFGTAPVLIEEDYEDVIRCFNPCAGEYFIAVDDKYRVQTLAREFTLTVAQTVKWFGEGSVSPSTLQMWKDGGPGLQSEIIIRHVIEPNDNDQILGVSKTFAYRQFYWEKGNQQGDQILAKRGYHEFPAIVPRWDLTANDAYGRSPGMDALPDIKQLQQETKRKGQAIDKMVNPPQVADMQLKNQPLSLLPGGVTFVAGLNSNGGVGMKPVYQVMPPIQEMKEDITEIQTRVKEVFFNDLFMMISQLQTVRSATEIDARREEKLIQLGPVLERVQGEGLDPALTRTFQVMLRAGLIPDPPQAIAGSPIEIEYISMFAEAQKAAATAGIERTAAFTGNLAAADPSALDNLQIDDMIVLYSDLLGNNPKIIASPDQVAAKRKARADQMKLQQAAQVGTAAVQGAQTLSQTDVGGGRNALQAMIGG